MQFAKGAFGSKFILTTSVSPAAVTSTLSTIDPQLIVTLSRTTVMLSSPTYFRAAGSARSITSITKVDVSSDSTAFETTFVALFALWLHWALPLDVDWFKNGYYILVVQDKYMRIQERIFFLYLELNDR